MQLKKQPGSSSMPQRVSAMQVIEGEDGLSRMGLLTQLELTPEVTIMGPGFNERFMRIRCGEHFYYVFREDLVRAGFPLNDLALRMAAAG